MPMFGQDTSFYDLLEKQSQAAVRAAQQLAQIADAAPDARPAQADTLKKLEEEADELVHALAARADEKMMTPLDKDDLQTLSVALDDLTDGVEAIAARFVIFHVGAARPDFAPLTQNVRDAMTAVHEAVCGLRHLRDHKKMQEQIVRVHELENASDALYRAALQTLFAEGGADPRTLITWKDIYDRTEAVLDRAEDVAVLLEGLVIKYA